MITIYGSPRTSAGRCFWMLEEIGQPYEPRALDMMEKREHKSPAYLRLNPNGKVPCLVEGDFNLWESTAINHYLAEKYRPELLGRDARERALVQQWTTWSMVELQPPMIDIIIQNVFLPEAQRDAAVVARAQEKIPGLLKILDQALVDRTYLVGETFTLADLNAASVAHIANMLKIPLDAYAHLGAWLGRLQQRPAYRKLMELRQGKA